MLENEGNLTPFSPLYNQEMSIGCSFTLKIKKMKKVLFCLLVIVCIAISWSCQNTKRYKIPKTNKVLLIYRPWFTGAAYVTVRDSGATALKKSDVDVIRVPVYETTELNFVLDLSNPDKIYYVDPWNIATPYPRQKRYKRIMYEDRRFYQPREPATRFDVRPGYIEVRIKDYADFVICCEKKDYNTLEPEP